MDYDVSSKEGKVTIEIEVGKAKAKAKAGEIIDAIEDAGFDVPEWEIPEVY